VLVLEAKRYLIVLPTSVASERLFSSAVQPVATCRQSPYLHKPATVIVMSFSLWRHWSHVRTNERMYGHLTVFNV